MLVILNSYTLAEEGDYDASEDQSGPSILEEESAVASSSSVGPQPEIDAKLADFFNVRKAEVSFQFIRIGGKKLIKIVSYGFNNY